MVFKRRDKRSFGKVVREFFWPRGGWRRAALYIKHRLHRLPDPPHRIARGILAGVFTTFTPLFGMHFVIAAFLAFIIRGNIIAALLATFFGNPLTYVPIAAVSLKTGYWMFGLSTDSSVHDHGTLLEKFSAAAGDLTHNLLTIVWGGEMDWSRLAVFYDEVFLPYLVGGIIPGLITGMICYYISVPLIQAYQNRRRGVIRDKLVALKKKAKLAPDGSKKDD